MKTRQDPRHLKRQEIVKNLYSFSFGPEGTDFQLIQKIKKKLALIDRKISQAAPEWPIAKINKIDLAILRLAVFELLEKKEPVKVIIDEAVELAKQFGGEKSPQFINGALGALINEKKRDK